MELIDANASVTALLRALLSEVPAQLRAVNRLASSSAQIRLRGVVATGYVAVDEHDGWVGSDLNHACRLLDAELLREALRERTDDFALCVSESVHDGIVRHDHPGIPADDFHASDRGQQERPAARRGCTGRCRTEGGQRPGKRPGGRGAGAARCRSRRPGLRHRAEAGRGPGIVARPPPAGPRVARPAPGVPGPPSSTSTAAPPASAARWSAATSTGCPAGRSRAMCTSAARAQGSGGRCPSSARVGPGLRLSRSGAG